MLLKERSCLPSQPFPWAQPPQVLWHVSTCLLFFPLLSSPTQPQGPHLSQDWGMWPWSPDSLTHKSSWSTCSSSVSSFPASPLDVLFPHICQTTLKPLQSHWKFRLALFYSLGLHLSYPWGICSKTTSGSLKPCKVPNPIYITYFPVHTYILQLLFGISKLHFGAVIK